MARHASIPLRSILVSFALLAGSIWSADAVADARMSESYGKLPLHFEANQGQAHEDVRFLSRGPGYSLYLTGSEAVLVLSRPDPQAKQDGRGTPGRRAAPAQTIPVTVRMSLVGAAPAPLVGGLEELPGKANYFVGNDPEKWRTNVPTYARVRYREVYPGIDLVYYGNQRQLEYDFVVAPGADPKKIVLGFKGADKIEIDANGDLVLHSAGGTLRQHKPIIYQETDGVRQEIAGSYVRRGAMRIGFKLAAYDPARPLVIDPVLAYSTYLGGSAQDDGYGIAVDANGNAYVTGLTGSTNFPSTPGAFHPISGGSAFVTKLDPSGSALLYSTYLGGSGADYAYAIAVDPAGSAYVTGTTSSSDFPTTTGAFQTTGSGVFVTKISADGSALVYSTYIGNGSFGSRGTGIAVDSVGNAHITGGTGSGFPTTPGAAQTTFGGRDSESMEGDAFVAKLNSLGSGLLYSTYLGGINGDLGNGIAVDAAGSAYVTGWTASPNFPVRPGAFQPIAGGSGDAFVTKLSPDGSTLSYSTFLGGSAGDRANGIAVDADGYAYVTGSTGSSNFPTTPGAFQPVSAGGGFVTKLHSTGAVLVYSTFLGGGYPTAIALDSAGRSYVTGLIYSDDLPTTPDAFQPAHAGHGDAFMTQLDPAGSALVYSTYLGGTGYDVGYGIAVDASGNAYLVGRTGTGMGNNDFPTTSGAFQTAFGGIYDAFAAKFGTATGGTPSPTTRYEENAAAYMGYWPSYGAETGTFSGGTIVASNQPAATATFSFTGTAVNWIGVRCNVCGIATVQLDGGAPTTVNTNGPGVSGSLTSEVVYSASGLAPGVTHTLVITVTGAQTGVPDWPTGNGHIAVDAFDVSN